MISVIKIQTTARPERICISDPPKIDKFNSEFPWVGEKSISLTIGDKKLFLRAVVLCDIHSVNLLLTAIGIIKEAESHKLLCENLSLMAPLGVVLTKEFHIYCHIK